MERKEQITNIAITSATVICSAGQDQVYLHTTLPGSAYPFEEPLILSFVAAKGRGAQYVKDNFDINAKVIAA